MRSHGLGLVRGGGIALVLLLASSGLMLGAPAWGAEAPAKKFPQVGTLPLFDPVGPPERSGWLILNPVSRRGYQVYEIDDPSPANPRTILQSFDLDTLRRLRRVELAGSLVLAGPGNVSVVGNGDSAEPLHAVDPEGRRLYLPLSFPQAFDQIPSQLVAAGSSTNDGKRPMTRFVAIDEDVLDRCGGEPDCPFAASFREPVGQERLHFYWPAGMKVTRQHVGRGETGRLLVLYAAPTGNGGDNTLVQWDPSRNTTGAMRFSAAAAMETENKNGVTLPARLLLQQVAAAGPPRRLDACASSVISQSSGGQGRHQWGLLALRDAVWTGCQPAQNAGAAVRVPMDAAGQLDPVTPLDLYRYSNRIADVLVDESGARLLMRSHGGGHTWWAFDTRSRRFTGAFASKVRDAYTDSVGLDPGTGRFYQLLQDYSQFIGGRVVPFRGGFSFSDTRLDPPPALENARPDLAYLAGFAIRVDPPTKRLFVRFGSQGGSTMPKYPGTDSIHPAPNEPSYRVLLDNVPLSVQPPAQDDSVFTTSVKEAPGLTQASYLGSASAYGSRVFLVGGYQRAGLPAQACGGDDREYLFGSVGEVSISEVSREGRVASADADSRTRADTSNRNLCRLGFEFDSYDNSDADGPPDGVNDYQASCLEQGGQASAPTEGFAAEVACDADRELVEGSATGEFVFRNLVSVGYAHSEVRVARDQLRGGVRVRVVSEARDVEIKGFGVIGLVRSEATSYASGRTGGAETSYERTVCRVIVPDRSFSDCLTKQEMRDLATHFNQRSGGNAELRFRDPDPGYADGSASGYQAAIQRDRLDKFQDQRIARDISLAVPGLELVFFRGDGAGGTGRQFFQFAGVEAATSYGIACLYGPAPSGGCNTDSFTSSYGPIGGDSSLGGYAAPSVITNRILEQPPTGPGRVVERIRRFAGRVGRGLLLALSSPVQGLLVASVWLLLYLPHYLGARRRLLPDARG